jgi:phytoene synthase
MSRAASYAFCERLARREAANFYPAFRVLPGPQRRAMCALYAFMRVTDDVSDSSATVPEKRAALHHWRAQFHQALRGQYTHKLHPAFHDTVSKYSIRVPDLEAVLDGVEMDLDTSSYATFAELYRYCYCVASAVGLCCIQIWGYKDNEALIHAENAGIAFQLTNILRDLGEDAARGRVYLPQEDLDRFGYRVDQIKSHERNNNFRELMQFQVERARGYYSDSRPLAKLLPPAGRAVFQVMRRTYEGLLDEIERREYDVFSSRVSLSSWQKLGFVAQAMPVRLGWVRDNG